jgi:hypothetical protein
MYFKLMSDAKVTKISALSVIAQFIYFESIYLTMMMMMMVIISSLLFQLMHFTTL